jgi:hypothetical protein
VLPAVVVWLSLLLPSQASCLIAAIPALRRLWLAPACAIRVRVLSQGQAE